MRKFISLFVAIMMVMSLVVPVFGSDGVDVTASYNKNAKTVTITVNGVTETFKDITNNTSKTFTVNGYEIGIAAKNDIATITSIKAVGASSAAAANPTSSNDQIVVDKDTRIWQDGFGFHCGGAVAVEYLGSIKGTLDAIAKINKKNPISKIVEKGDQKDIFGTKTFPVTLERVGMTTAWNLMTDDIKCTKCGRTDWVTYSNNSGVINGKHIQCEHPPIVEEEPLKGTFSVDKTVNGIAFTEWALDYDGDLVALLGDISFALFAKGSTAPIATATIDLGSGAVVFTWENLDFENLPAGEYYIVEYLGDIAKEVFNNANGEVVVEFTIGADGKVVGGESDFDKNGKYTAGHDGMNLAVLYEIKDGYGTLPDYYPINPNFQDFFVTSEDGKEFKSFCSYYASMNLGDFYVDQTAVRFAGDDAQKKADIISALNYINNTWGSLDQWPEDYVDFNNGGYEAFDKNGDSWWLNTNPESATKMIAQLVIWYLLDDGVESAAVIGRSKWANEGEYEDAGIGYGFINEAVYQVLQNYEGYTGGSVTDIVFLAEEGYVKRTPGQMDNHQPQIVPIIGKFTFNNTTDDPPLKGKFSLTKTVNGIAFSEWLLDEYLAGFDFDDWADAIAALADGIKFELRDSNNNVVATADAFDPSIGKIIFDADTLKGLADGEYYIVEILTGVAKEVFNNADGEVAMKVIIINGAVIGGDGFDASALYRDNYFYGQGHVFDLGHYDWTELTAGGQIRTIMVQDVDLEDAEWLSSFCAHGGSATFASNGPGHLYKVATELADPEKLADAIAALNYINNKYGSYDSYEGFFPYGEAVWEAAIIAYNNGDKDDYFDLMKSQTRLLSQIAVWHFFCGIDIDIVYWQDGKGIHLPDQYQYAIEDVIKNGLTGEGDLSAAYLICAEHGLGDEVSCQPQLVPYTLTFNNTTDNPLKGTPSFNKVKYGGKIPFEVANEFAFDLFQIINGEEVYIDTYYTDVFGAVTTGELDPGDYVFKEGVSTYTIPGVDEYKLLWKAVYPVGANGLYFEISKAGDVVWTDYPGEGNPTVDNIFWNKSFVQWVPIGLLEQFTGMGTIGEIFEDGFIFYPGGVDAGEEVICEVTEATCTQGGMLWFYYSKADGSAGEPLMSIPYSAANGHVYMLDETGDWLCCENCSYCQGYWDLAPELYEVYKELGGLGVWPIDTPEAGGMLTVNAISILNEEVAITAAPEDIDDDEEDTAIKEDESDDEV